jgi:GT2 family glycosyltransferase
MFTASAIVPTRDRAASLRRTLASLAHQDCLPAELIVIDASTDEASRDVTQEWAQSASPCQVIYRRAEQVGAAAQRNQGVAIATQPFIWFFDDDVLFEPECVAHLWRALESDPAFGGVNAMITNQRYQTPGRVSRTLFRLLDGRTRGSYAGKCIGPAFNLLPEDDPALAEVVPVDWLNTTCTLYRREALPATPFDSHFTGYSLMEDLALSLVVGQRWKLANARLAKIHHNSQPGEYKARVDQLSEMELVNRHYIMTRIMGKRAMGDYLRLGLWEAFQVVGCALRAESRPQFWATCKGKITGARTILAGS